MALQQSSRKLLKEKYGFDPTEQWLVHVQKASVRFNSGGSGSFVSADGLVMTNHHVGLGALQKLSKPGKDYVKEGFYAKTLDEEFKSVDEELNVLMDIADVTDQVKAAVKPDMTPEKAFEARRGVIANIESDSDKKTGLRSNVVTLYQGGQYHLYRLQALHRRAPRVRSGAADRVFRRRCRQLRVSALRSRCLLLPRLRERQAGQDRALS